MEVIHKNNNNNEKILLTHYHKYQYSYHRDQPATLSHLCSLSI